MNILAYPRLIAIPSSPYSNASCVTPAVKNRPNPLYTYNTITKVVRFLSRIIFCYRLIFVKNSTFITASRLFFVAYAISEVSL